MAGILDKPVATDETVLFLDKIFGSGWGDILDTMAAPAGGAGGVFMTLFSAFNAVVLAAVTVLILYVVSAGIIGTAHEGEPLGKRYSTLWTPLRMAFAVSLLMPLPNVGYSLLQVLILYFTSLGIGGANYLETQVVDYMKANSGAIEMPPPAESVDKAATTALFALMAQSYYTVYMGASMSEDRFSCDTVGNKNTDYGTTNPNDIICTFGVPEGASFDRKDLGGIIIPCTGGTEMCEARRDEFKKVTDQLKPIADALVSRFEGGPDAEVNPDEMANILYSYSSTLANKLQTFVNDMNPRAQTAMDQFADVATAKGWGFLGAWYWTIAGHAEHAREQVVDNHITVLPIDATAIAQKEKGTFQAFVDRYNNLIDRTTQKKLTDAATSFDTDTFAGLSRLINNINFGTMLVNSLSNGDPIANLQSVGHSMIGAGFTGLTILNKLNAMGLGKKAAADNEEDSKSGLSFSSAARWVVSKTDSLTGGIMGSMVTVAPYFLMTLIFGGIGLAYYLPAIPYVLWTMGIIGWVILVLESMVAAPLWAAAHAVPEGEGLAGQHGRQGYMLFMGVLMRPALMVVGFFSAYVLMNVVGHFIGLTFTVFIAGMMQDSGMLGALGAASIASGAAGFLGGGGPFGFAASSATTFAGMSLLTMLATVFIGGGTLIVASHKVFGLITWLPDNVMRWLGGGGMSLHEQGDESRISGIFVGGISKVQNVSSPLARFSSQEIHKENKKAGGSARGAGNPASHTGAAGTASPLASEAERDHMPGASESKSSAAPKTVANTERESEANTAREPLTPGAEPGREESAPTNPTQPAQAKDQSDHMPGAI